MKNKFLFIPLRWHVSVKIHQRLHILVCWKNRFSFTWRLTIQLASDNNSNQQEHASYSIVPQNQDESGTFPCWLFCVPTVKDIEATRLLLEIRAEESWMKKFEDRKYSKLILWNEITVHLRQNGLNVNAEVLSSTKDIHRLYKILLSHSQWKNGSSCVFVTLNNNKSYFRRN